jgi:copper chaperone
METIVLKVGGMSCGGCVNSIHRVLTELPGVANADVSLERGEATVTFDASQVTRVQMTQAIDDAGFAAS